MIMKKKYLIIGISCLFLIATGISYSCAYRGNVSKEPFISTLAAKDSISTEMVLEDSGAVTTEVKEELIAEGIKANGSKANGSKANGSKADGSKAEGSKAEGSKVDGPIIEGLIREDQGKERPETLLYVHLCGAVEQPDVYKVVPGTRLFEVIELAGGLTKTAAADYINQAMKVEDGQRIYIPTKDEMKELDVTELLEYKQEETDTNKDLPKLVNINEADSEELMELPGIGQAKAASIIEYRSTKGEFKSIEDLMNIPGIKEGLFHQVEAYIAVK